MRHAPLATLLATALYLGSALPASAQTPPPEPEMGYCPLIYLGMLNGIYYYEAVPAEECDTPSTYRLVNSTRMHYLGCSGTTCRDPIGGLTTEPPDAVDVYIPENPSTPPPEPDSRFTFVPTSQDIVVEADKVVIVPGIVNRYFRILRVTYPRGSGSAVEFFGQELDPYAIPTFTLQGSKESGTEDPTVRITTNGDVDFPQDTLVTVLPKNPF